MAIRRYEAKFFDQALESRAPAAALNLRALTEAREGVFVQCIVECWQCYHLSRAQLLRICASLCVCVCACVC